MMQQKAVVEIRRKTRQALPKKLLDCKSKVNLNKDLSVKKCCLLQLDNTNKSNKTDGRVQQLTETIFIRLPFTN